MRHKSSARVYLIAGNSVLGCFYFGYALGYLNPSQPSIDTVFNLCAFGDKSTIAGLVNAMLPIGAALGAFVCGPLLAKTTRVKCLLLTDVVSVIGTLLGIIVNLYMLCLSRFIIGVAVGLNSTLIPLYIKEQTPIELRGPAGSMNQITVNVGIFAALLMGLGYPEYPDKMPECSTDAQGDYWKIVFLLPLAAPILRTIFLFTVFRDDPPGYYVSIGEKEQALEVLNKIYKEEFVQEELSELERDERRKQLGSQSYSDLFGKALLRRLIIGCLLCALQQFSGINAVIFYSTEIFKSMTSDHKTINLLNIAVGLTNIIFALVAGGLLKKVGRKALLLLGDFICFCCLALLTVFSLLAKNNDSFQIPTVGFLFLYLIGFQLSLGPIVWIYLAEILPEKGLSLAVLANWICVSLVTFIFPILNSAASIQFCFGLFAGFCFFGLFFVQIFVKETKGRTAQSIDNMYSMAQGLLHDDSSTDQPSQTIQK